MNEEQRGARSTSAVARPFVEVVHPPAGELEPMGLERIELPPIGRCRLGRSSRSWVHCSGGVPACGQRLAGSANADEFRPLSTMTRSRMHSTHDRSSSEPCTWPA